MIYIIIVRWGRVDERGILWYPWDRMRGGPEKARAVFKIAKYPRVEAGVRLWLAREGWGVEESTVLSWPGERGEPRVWLREKFPSRIVEQQFEERVKEAGWRRKTAGMLDLVWKSFRDYWGF